MSSHSLLDTSIDRRTESRLLLAPYDIRRAIYLHLLPVNVHVFLNQRSKLCLSGCFESPIEDALPKDRCSGCKPPICYSHVSIWGRRLHSSWGTHWKCEEHLKTLGCSLDLTLLLVCKRLYIDVAEHIVEEAIFHVTDPVTLGFLSQRELLDVPRGFSPHSFLSSVFLNIKELHITMRLSLAECKEIERLTADSIPDFSRVEVSAAVLQPRTTAWLHICPAIAQLKELRRLRIWVDHDDESSWSVVNERAILYPLEPLIGIADLDMSVSLPKLHPRHENPYRHFIQDNPVFNIHRRLRQIHHGRKYKHGTFGVNTRRDFPISGNFFNDLYDFMDMQVEQMSPAELERKERERWVKVGDVEDLMSDWPEFSHSRPTPYKSQLNIPWGE